MNFSCSSYIRVSVFRSKNGRWGWCLDYMLGIGAEGWGGGHFDLSYVRTEKEGAETEKLAAINGLRFLKGVLKEGMNKASRWKRHNYKPLEKRLDSKIKELRPQLIQMSIFDYTSETLNLQAFCRHNDTQKS